MVIFTLTVLKKIINYFAKKEFYYLSELRNSHRTYFEKKLGVKYF